MEASALQAPAGLSRISLGSPLLRLRSDEQLITAFRAGNEDAFRVIHDRYRSRLTAYARQMLGGARQDAEDVVQDVFIRAHRGLGDPGRTIALRGWLYRVTHNRCIDHLRRPGPAPEELIDLARVPAHDPTTIAERRDDLRRLVADVRRLPAQQRSALLLREFEGFTYQELAQALDVTVPAVKSLLVRARGGLVDAGAAREAACVDIRADLALAQGRGVRANARARRHLRDCAGCREYRTGMRRLNRSLGALVPVGAGPAGLLAKLGLGSSGAGATGAGLAAGGGAISSTTAALSATKLAVVLCSVVVTAGGAAKVTDELVGVASQHHAKSMPAHVGAEAAQGATATSVAAPHVAAAAADAAQTPVPAPAPPDAATQPTLIDSTGATAAELAAEELPTGGTLGPSDGSGAAPADTTAPAGSTGSTPPGAAKPEAAAIETAGTTPSATGGAPAGAPTVPGAPQT